MRRVPRWDSASGTGNQGVTGADSGFVRDWGMKPTLARVVGGGWWVSPTLRLLLIPMFDRGERGYNTAVDAGSTQGPDREEIVKKGVTTCS